MQSLRRQRVSILKRERTLKWVCIFVLSLCAWSSQVRGVIGLPDVLTFTKQPSFLLGEATRQAGLSFY